MPVFIKPPPNFNVIGAVSVVHSDGTTSTYNPTANTDAARGTALNTAVTNLAVGDTIYLTANTFDIGSSNIVLTDNSNIIGSGKFATTIKSSANLNFVGPIIIPGTGSRISDFSIIATPGANVFSAYIGFYSAVMSGGPPTTFFVMNIKGTGSDSDGLYFNDDTVIGSCQFYHCEFSSKWDCFYLNDSMSYTVDLHEVTLTVVGPSLITGGGYSGVSHGITTNFSTGSLTRMYGGSVSASGGTSGNTAVQNQNSPIELYATKVTSSGTVPKDLFQSGSTLTVFNALYDNSKTVGTITIGNDLHSIKLFTDEIKGGNAYTATNSPFAFFSNKALSTPDNFIELRYDELTDPAFGRTHILACISPLCPTGAGVQIGSDLYINVADHDNNQNQTWIGNRSEAISPGDWLSSGGYNSGKTHLIKAHDFNVAVTADSGVTIPANFNFISGHFKLPAVGGGGTFSGTLKYLGIFSEGDVQIATGKKLILEGSLSGTNLTIGDTYFNYSSGLNTYVDNTLVRTQTSTMGTFIGAETFNIGFLIGTTVDTLIYPNAPSELTIQSGTNMFITASFGSITFSCLGPVLFPSTGANFGDLAILTFGTTNQGGIYFNPTIPAMVIEPQISGTGNLVIGTTNTNPAIQFANTTTSSFIFLVNNDTDTGFYFDIWADTFINACDSLTGWTEETAGSFITTNNRIERAADGQKYVNILRNSSTVGSFDVTFKTKAKSAGEINYIMFDMYPSNLPDYFVNTGLAVKAEVGQKFKVNKKNFAGNWDSTTIITGSTTTVTADVEYLIRVTRSAANLITLYINGTSEGTVTDSVSFAAGNNHYFTFRCSKTGSYIDSITAYYANAKNLSWRVDNSEFIKFDSNNSQITYSKNVVQTGNTTINGTLTITTPSIADTIQFNMGELQLFYNGRNVNPFFLNSPGIDWGAQNMTLISGFYQDTVTTGTMKAMAISGLCTFRNSYTSLEYGYCAAQMRAQSDGTAVVTDYYGYKDSGNMEGSSSFLTATNRTGFWFIPGFYGTNNTTLNLRALYCQLSYNQGAINNIYWIDCDDPTTRVAGAYTLRTAGGIIGLRKSGSSTASYISVGALNEFKRYFDGTNGYLNLSAGDLHVATAAQKTIQLDTTVWKDVFFPQSIPKATGAGNPTLTNWTGGLNNYSYAVNDGYDADPQEFPHDGKQGVTTGSFHVHWISRTNVAATRGVKWQIEYTFANIGSAFPATTTISAEETVAANTPVGTHYLTTIGTFTTPNIGAQMCLRLTRITAAGTAPATDPIVLGTHYHYEVDTIGSRQISTK